MTEINTINSQIKGFIESSAVLLTQIGQKETYANKLTAQIKSGNAAIANLNHINSEKKTELSSTNEELKVINQEINSVDTKINNTNTKIAKVEKNISDLKSQSQPAGVKEVTPENGKIKVEKYRVVEKG